ncbi:hypothetical protein J5N97_004628 [Dioscorea zingiberensis]|uniref:chlorophyll(ide) b reductase n=1 Tax=Dioscorea zingiberensis TaxID=325984 RepID=A0A9D5D883_9LILI|nr:hypothetical protein J5N97_004628 [Dioscorea zingiberensis]
MAAIAKLQISVQSFYHPSSIDFSIPNWNSRPHPNSGPNPVRRDGVSSYRWWRHRQPLSPMRCRSFKSEEEETGRVPLKRKGPLYSLKSLIRKVSGMPSQTDGQYRKAVEKVEEIFFSIATQLGRYLLTNDKHRCYTCSWISVISWLGGIIIGTMIGANIVLEEHCNAGPRNVVITGSTRGLGKALAREFLLSGDRVVVASRSPESVCTTVEELNEYLKEGISMAGEKGKAKFSHAKVVGMAVMFANLIVLGSWPTFAINELGSIDIWINNAGTNKGFRPLIQFTDEDITQIVSTNLIGSLICTKEALHVMKSQGKGGHIFNMDGAGSGGSSTPLTAVYGSTKCGLRQLHASLLKECKRSKTGIHTASPGMVLTDLLLSGSTLRNKQMFNIICELPETVARTLVPRMRAVKGSGKAINYLTPPRILLALVTAWLRRGRWFDDQGRALYAAEADRIRNWAESRARFSFTDAMDMLHALNELFLLVLEPIYNANDHDRLGGLVAVVQGLHDSEPEIQTSFAWILGNACQNNAIVQKHILQHGALTKLLKMELFFFENGELVLRDIMRNFSVDIRVHKKVVLLVLDLADSQLTNVVLSGKVLLNGKKQRLDYGVMAYVTHENVLLGTLTVSETFISFAYLQLPTTMRKKHMQATVE